MSSKYLLARLLSGRNQLSREEKDAVLARVLADIAPRRKLRRRSLWLALAGAAAVVALLPVALRDRGDRAIDERFAARGDASAGLVLVCDGQPAGACRTGQKLLFDLQGAARDYFAAFARRGDGSVIWYFPDAPSGHSLDLRDRLINGVLDRGVVLDATHPPGRYQVYGIYSDAPLSRDDIKARFRPGAADLGAGTTLATRELVVQ